MIFYSENLEHFTYFHLGHNVGAERMLAMSKNKKNGKADHRRKSSEFNIQSEVRVITIKITDFRH